MHKPQSLFYLTAATHVSVVTITHLQEHKTTVTRASGNRYTVLLSVAIVEEYAIHNTLKSIPTLPR
jgi:translation elongation factor EF-Tu-like GTPase